MQDNVAQSLSIKETIHRYWLENSGRRIAYGLGGGYLGSHVHDQDNYKEKTSYLTV